MSSRYLVAQRPECWQLGRGPYTVVQNPRADTQSPSFTRIVVISLKLRPPKPGHAVSPATLTGSAQIVRFPSQCYSLRCTEVAASSMSLVVSFGYDM